MSIEQQSLWSDPAPETEGTPTPRSIAKELVAATTKPLLPKTSPISPEGPEYYSTNLQPLGTPQSEHEKVYQINGTLFHGPTPAQTAAGEPYINFWITQGGGTTTELIWCTLGAFGDLIPTAEALLPGQQYNLSAISRHWNELSAEGKVKSVWGLFVTDLRPGS